MKIVKPTRSFNNELSVASDAFDFSSPPFDPEAFAEALAQKMIRENGIGLAAIQVGVPLRVYAIRTEPMYVCFNPKIVDVGGKEMVAEEACLSFPGMTVKVRRFDEVRLRFQLHNGQFVTRKLAGLAARVVQHEQDHIDGILFYERANRYHREQALRRWERSLKKEKVL